MRINELIAILRWVTHSQVGNSVFIVLLLPGFLNSQDTDFRSIHHEQSEYFHQFAEKPASFFDSLNGFTVQPRQYHADSCTLNKRVFGFHPFWMGSSYLNYQWNLLSDLCYFSYEVDPATGEPATTHGWLTDPSVDSAQANGVRTHLCATLFSGHYAFFGNPGARQNLIDHLITLVQQRNADGINIDFEAVPPSLGSEVTSFMIDLSQQFHAAQPQGILSIDLPSVDWGNVFDLKAMADHVDLFFVMGYDYYINGSGTAGPVAPMYSMTDVYQYNLCRTISDHQTAGLPSEKFILGLPYYGRQWKTLFHTVPSGTIGYGTALTYANVRSNAGGNYTGENHFWEANSFSSAYIFYQNDEWFQCFIGLERDMKKRYDLVNYRGLAGIGIWALGYDDGYTELWDAIRSRFTDCADIRTIDTLYDCGGPAWNYYNLEDYHFTVKSGGEGGMYLDFLSLSTEPGFDSIWIYSGDTSLSLLGSYTGLSEPPRFSSPGGDFTLRFKSDALTTAPGWEAVWHDGTYGVVEAGHNPLNISAVPNPFWDKVSVYLPFSFEEDISIFCHDVLGRSIPFYMYNDEGDTPDQSVITLRFPMTTQMDRGFYFLQIWNSKGFIGTIKLVRSG